MTKVEVKAFETDAVIFPIQFDQNDKDTVSTEETAEQIVVENEPNKINLGLRFARLKKSLRKRSASIL